jgi:ubiquinone/menaquinone biosynthesis C-methylase UbiE
MNSDVYSCSQCNSVWQVEHGIPRFARSEVKWSVFDDEIAEKVTDMAEQTSWLEAVDAYADTIGAYTLRYIKDESRADWHVILPLGPEAVVLDIGSGWGNIALSLAKRCRKLHCADVNMTNLRLLRTRLRDRGVENVSIFQYEPNDYLHLPFTDSTFDVVLLNGVLEWMGAAKINASPKKIQLAALKEIRRVLKADGALYIGIENRFSTSTLCGQRIHGELPFVGLLPRPASNFITKLVRGEPHRTYIYSYGGYRRLLQKAGFHKIDFYIPYPSYHHPNYLIPLEPSWVKRFWIDQLSVSRSKKYQLFQRLNLSRLPFHWFAYSYSIRCTK